MGENNNKRVIAFVKLFNLDLGGNVKSVCVTDFFSYKQKARSLKC